MKRKYYLALSILCFVFASVFLYALSQPSVTSIDETLKSWQWFEFWLLLFSSFATLIIAFLDGEDKA